MWLWLFVTLALLAMVSLIARVFLAIRAAPQDRRLHVQWAAASAASMVVFVIASSLSGSGRSRRRWRFENDLARRGGGQETAMMMAGVAL